MIVFCHLLNDHSGSPSVLRATLNALSSHEQGQLFVGSQGRGLLEDVGVPTRRYWYRRSRYRLVTLFTFLASQMALYRALTRASDIPPGSVIFVNTLLPFGAMLWGRQTGRRVVVHVHEVSITPELLRRFLTRCAARCADLLIYVSHDHVSRLPIKGPPTKVIPNPISRELANKAQKVRYVPHRNGAFVITMLASPRSYKGIEEFFNLARALQRREDIKFTLVLNADETETSAVRREHAGTTNVTVHARTNDPSNYYAQSDLVLNLSRPDQWVETFGLTLVEAMAFGVPVIGPPVGGPAEIITHGQEGYCIDSRDSTALQAAVLELADNSERALAMSMAARKRASDFTFEGYARRMREIITELPDLPRADRS